MIYSDEGQALDEETAEEKVEEEAKEEAALAGV